MKITFLSVCLLALIFTFSTQTFAVDFTVNLTTDQPDASLADGICDIDLATAGEQCTLRAAVKQANNLASDDRVLFNLPPNSTVPLTFNNGGAIYISRNNEQNMIIDIGTLEIIGTGANNLTISRAPNSDTITSNIFTIYSAVVTISGVTLTGGGNSTRYVDPPIEGGGAIEVNGGTLMLDRVHITGNRARSGGGVKFVGGTHRIINSTISNNTSLGCGGISNVESTLTIVNTTISGNTAAGRAAGGGLCASIPAARGDTSLRNVTITNNTATFGGGIYRASGNLNFGNTVVAGNTATEGPEICCANIVGDTSSVISVGGNLIGDSADDSPSLIFTYQPTDIRDTNPMLGALQNNGGTTLTHALLLGSPAIDRGLNALAPASTDQRGFPRIVDGDGNGTAIVDIGAYESPLGTTAASVSVSGRVTARGRGISNAVVHLTSQSGEILTSRTNRLGYYTFTDLAVGETYIFNVFSKRYQFNPKVISLTEDLDELNFTAQ